MPEESRLPPPAADPTAPRDPEVVRCKKCGAQAPVGTNHCSRGHFLPQNLAPQTHGLKTAERRGYFPDRIAERESAFYAQVLADLGGSDNITAIEHGYVHSLVRANTTVMTLGEFIREKGPITKTGRQRTCVSLFFAACATYDRMAQRLGLQRRTKPVTRSLEDVLADVIAEQEAETHATP